MLVLKLLQSLVKALHSEGTPGQVAAGIALGFASLAIWSAAIATAAAASRRVG